MPGVARADGRDASTVNSIVFQTAFEAALSCHRLA
jgi:hypothetical protein